MPLPLVTTLAKIAGVEPGHDVEWFDVSEYRPRPSGLIPWLDYQIAVFGRSTLDG